MKSENLPMVIHVNVEVVEAGEDGVALDTVHGPEVVLDLVLVLADSGVVVVARRLGLGGGQGGLGDHGGLGQVVQGELGVLLLLLLGGQSRGEDGGHLRLLLLYEPTEGEGKAEVWEGGRVVEGGVERLELDCVGWLGRDLLRHLLLAAGNGWKV